MAMGMKTAAALLGRLALVAPLIALVSGKADAMPGIGSDTADIAAPLMEPVQQRSVGGGGFGGGRGGGGFGRSFGPSFVITPRIPLGIPGLNDDTPDRPRDRGRPSSRRPNPDQNPTPERQVACSGGRVSRGQCVCRPGMVRRAVRPRVFACAPGSRPDNGSRVGVLITPTPPATPPRNNKPGRKAQNTTPPRRIAPNRPIRRAPIPGAGLPALAQNFAPDQVLVSVAQATPAATDSQVAQSFNLQLLASWPLSQLDQRLVLYRIPDGRSVATVVQALQGDPRVNAPQPNFYYTEQASAAPSPAAAPLQYTLAKLKLPDAHRLAEGRGSLVAVVDSGIDTTHPDLSGSVEGVFDATLNGAGSIGDHGTAIAGIIGGKGMIEGVAPAAKVLGVTAFTKLRSGHMTASTASLLRGMDWAVSRLARVINLSVAGPRDPMMENAVTTFTGRGLIIVAAAGNEGAKAPPAYPAAYPDVIAVTATDDGDKLYDAANQGGHIAVAAPGVDVLAPALKHGHSLQTGTSFAAAHVSGIIALLLERDAGLTPSGIRTILTQSAADLGDPGNDPMFGAGRADADAALKLITAVPAFEAEGTATTQNVSNGGSGN